MQNGKYYVNLPLKSLNLEDIDDNHAVVETGLIQHYRRLSQNKEILHDYR